MKNKHVFQQKLLALALGAAALALSQEAAASAFALAEQSASGQGNAFAGGAASAEDASVVWFNPAAMSQLKTTTVTGGVNFVKPSAKFSDRNSVAACAAPSLCKTKGGDGGDAGSWAAVPNLYMVTPISEKLSFGLGVNAPFGLKTEYDDDWVGRYQARKSEVKTININPALSFKVNDMVAFGVGASYQRFEATFTSAINYSAVVASGASTLAKLGQITPTQAGQVTVAGYGLADGSSRLHGDSTAYGWNVGVLLTPSPALQIGAQYRSSIKQKVKGTAVFNAPTSTNGTINAILGAAASGTLANGDVQVDIKTPETASISAFWRASPTLDLMADATWTKWSNIPDITFVRSSGTTLTSTTYDWKDTWRLSAGANYHLSDALTLRGGIAWDQTPMDDAHRTARLPDNDRIWLSVGAGYNVGKNLTLDVGYTHIFVKDSQINARTEGAGNVQSATLDGTYKNDVNIVAVGASYRF